MYRKLVLVGTAALSALALAACGGGGSPAQSQDSSSPGGEGQGGQSSVINVMNAPLGDQGFFDDAARGIDMLAADGFKTENLQAEADNPSQWRANLEAASSADWDVVVVGTAQMVDILDETAPKYPEQSYILYDSVVEQPNVASITYKQNEGSFLAGVLAAEAVKNPELFPLTAGQNKVGAVAGMDIPIINDFILGFKKGVESVDPSIEVLVSFVGDFTDANRAYDQASAMYAQGAGVVYQLAAGAGLGVLRAAEETGHYAIGVDSNQNPLHEGHILASMLKNIDTSLKSAVELHARGELEFGKVTEYGLANGGVGLTFEGNGDIVPAQIQEAVQEYAQKVIDGEIVVPTAL